MAAQQLTPGRRAAVLGSPIGHSLSPVLHRAAYSALGLDWSYEAIEVTEAELAGFLDGLDTSWAGLSLTMPLKRAVIPLLDEVRGVGATVRAVNTVLLAGGRRVGENTDVPGIVAALRPALGHRGRAQPPRTAVLGGGATAASALAALVSLGVFEAEMYVRSAARAADTVEIGQRLGITVAVRPWSDTARALAADLVVSTTTAGASDPLADRVRAAPGLLFDVIYDPWPTRLAAAWQSAGGMVVGGFELLLQQGALQVELMTGRPAPINAMRAAIH